MIVLMNDSSGQFSINLEQDFLVYIHEKNITHAAKSMD
jgi:hypothetical protein